MGHAIFGPNLNAWRFYGDGDEPTSPDLAAQDTDITVDVDGGDVQVHIRMRIDEQGGVDGDVGDDWRIQFDKNGGGYEAIGAATSNVQCDPTSGLTDGLNTTNRVADPISDPGAGNFVGFGADEGDGQVANEQLTANDFTEVLWALLIIAADVSNADTLDFRVTLNGGDPGLVANVVPRITISKTAAARRIMSVS